MAGFLQNQKVVLGITAGIAAYKIPFLVRLLIKEGASVKVIMTPKAKEFVTPLTLSTLSKHDVITSFTDEEDEVWNNHVDLGLWADFMLVAPATANTLAKMAHAQSDNFLLATYLSAKCPVFIAPAMDLDMYKHPGTQNALDKLSAFGNLIIPVGTGELASGLSGEGRMAEPQDIINYILNYQRKQKPWSEKKVLITAGPTYEALDPVRFIGNHSSGKMGFALAKEAAKLGAQVVMVSGPTNQKIDSPNVTLIKVTSTKEMYDAVFEHYNEVDIAIAAAAVSDYRPVQKADQKIKKSDQFLEIRLEKTEDILKAMGEAKSQQFLMGFALETENELKNARGKLQRKHLDAIVLNSLNDKGAGFKQPTNKIRIIDPQQVLDYELKTKDLVAKDILNYIQSRLNN
ncbi:bifunctional phosphopantothenoylcysteine decarboxylase/phosphopantothenate--cysteine ligase CoaBC [Mesonia sp. HuA40]|uniref:bifunctional phosphopantothenoylcysteine decarboxylase/phosphopantothenate--cysteine ligase CoaBC n=1 Tax=Mesonia sp. HuA40 TaxID=2602761 RepID=UPI0011CBC881|nr:bifunctional phosphopantothenoylcysteine decarboxylase/phosphopantothenate--cysteine ligase CoaBC [Mesonia sp. HuA40]TXK74312.1 bifunctional phosphopantothenoylcysteine decarboxylase/phosphopantothenate--cysteine ligase CoaBC [Mesonia sp. HuA40]